jgi:AcrR family transcriptional regulator
MTERPLSALYGAETSTLERIRINAMEHFSQFGYLGASIREITQASNVTKPTLYYYFNSKEALYKDLAASCMDNVLKVLESSILKKATFSDRFCSLIQSYNGICQNDFPAARFVHMVSVAPSRYVPDVGIDKFNRNKRALITKIVFDSTQSGEIQGDKGPGIELILCGLFSMATEYRIKGINLPIDEIRNAVECLLIKKV